MQTVVYASPSKSDRCIGICCTGLDPALFTASFQNINLLRVPWADLNLYAHSELDLTFPCLVNLGRFRWGNAVHKAAAAVDCITTVSAWGVRCQQALEHPAWVSQRLLTSDTPGRDCSDTVYSCWGSGICKGGGGGKHLRNCRIELLTYKVHDKINHNATMFSVLHILYHNAIVH